MVLNYRGYLDELSNTIKSEMLGKKIAQENGGILESQNH